jgi:hypothetical protein
MGKRMKQASRLGTTAFTLATLCLGRTVHAADEGDDLIKQGIECRRKRDDACGLRFFEEAYDKGHSPRALAQIALAEQALGKWVAASEHLRQALAVRGDAWIEKNRAVLNDSAARVAAHVGFIEIFGGSPGAEVRVDGTARGTLPLARPLATTTGTIAIDLVMMGRLPFRRTTTVQAGETTREAFDELPVESTGKAGGGARDDRAMAGRAEAVGDRSPASSSGDSGPTLNAMGTESPPVGGTAPADQEPPASLRWPLVIGTAALSAGALIFATVEYGKWSGNVDSFNRMACNPLLSNRGSAECASLYGDAGTENTLMYVGFAAAGALAATSVVLYFALEQPGTAANHQVACLPTAGSRGVTCAFHF